MDEKEKALERLQILSKAWVLQYEKRILLMYGVSIAEKRKSIFGDISQDITSG